MTVHSTAGESFVHCHRNSQGGLRQPVHYPRLGLRIFQPFGHSEKTDDRMSVFMAKCIQLDTDCQEEPRTGFIPLWAPNEARRRC